VGGVPPVHRTDLVNGNNSRKHCKARLLVK
jgi:hypothetical protein